MVKTEKGQGNGVIDVSTS